MRLALLLLLFGTILAAMAYNAYRDYREQNPRFDHDFREWELELARDRHPSLYDQNQ